MIKNTVYLKKINRDMPKHISNYYLLNTFSVVGCFTGTLFSLV